MQKQKISTVKQLFAIDKECGILYNYIVAAKAQERNDLMKIVQRIGGRGFSGNRLKEFIKTVKKHPNSMNAVWLNTRYGYPSLDDHKEYANTLAHMAKALRAEGISVDLQLSNSIGHGEYMSKLDCSALVCEGSPVRMMVGHDGVVANYSLVEVCGLLTAVVSLVSEHGF